MRRVSLCKHGGFFIRSRTLFTSVFQTRHWGKTSSHTFIYLVLTYLVCLWARSVIYLVFQTRHWVCLWASSLHEPSNKKWDISRWLLLTTWQKMDLYQAWSLICQKTNLPSVRPVSTRRPPGSLLPRSMLACIVTHQTGLVQWTWKIMSISNDPDVKDEHDGASS